MEEGDVIRNRMLIDIKWFWADQIWVSVENTGKWICELVAIEQMEMFGQVMHELKHGKWRDVLLK
jgi:hypothetical protein